MKNMYNSVMDPESNSLKRLPPVQRFQVMTYLGLMWTLIFCIGSGAWLWFGHLAVLHIGMASGFLITGWTFQNARKSGTQGARISGTYRDHPREDGTARYDDVWGA